MTARLYERSGGGKFTYLGADLPARAKVGETVRVTHYFRVETEATGDHDVFVHVEDASAGRVAVADHAPLSGRHPIPRWRAGEIWADEHPLTIPADATGSALQIYVGLFKGEVRWEVEAAPGGSDGNDRVRLGSIAIDGASDGLPEVTIPRAKGPIEADGALDEAAWKDAPVLTFADTMGRPGAPKFPTELRLLYDDTHLYVGFTSEDQDITERYAKRDDPIYEHETVELFIMPHVVAPALGPYVELQASPTGVIFDAAFTARRTGMDTKFDAAQTVGTKLDGTLNDDAKDARWVSEWKVPFTSLRFVNGPPKSGDEWRMNAFRIEKYREGGQLAGEYTAWSPPLVGDFHNVARFGRMRFGD